MIPGQSSSVSEKPLYKTLGNRLAETGASPLSKYLELYVGESSLARFLQYEVLTFCLSPLPGALGLILRKMLYGWLFASMGRGTAMGAYVTIRCPKNISLGANVFIDGSVVLDAKGAESQISLGDSVLVGSHSVLSCASSTITLGSDVAIGPHCHIRAGLCPVTIGSYVTIGSPTTSVWIFQ
jgi:hypothetical protein